ncbi:hypothetical protein VNI00_005765 [Paramarasmius palmivorus]|uniref:Uncharacterized protein n=1 Tax=Paramarasmius palmivorus TaxID=297713 RepID=A0AAW0DGA9_9AGAR
MTTKSQNVSPFSRLSRAFGLNSKSNTPSSSSPRPGARLSEKVKEDEDDWYIPYNGPYEPPRPPARQEKDRDSWGDPVGGDEDIEEEHMLGDPELHHRYGGIDGGNVGDWKTRGSGSDRKLRQRTRTTSGGSVLSGRTVSSGTVDPGRMSVGTHPRRSTVSTGSPRPPIPSYVNIDVTGGVGESPMPTYRGSNAGSTPTTRRSLASLFTFNSSSKRRPTSRPPPDPNRHPLPSSPTAHSQDPSKRPASLIRNQTDPISAEEALRASGAGGDEEYYQSFYPTLIDINSDNKQQPASPGMANVVTFNSPRQEPNSASSHPSSNSGAHPYAYSGPEPPELDAPQSAPPTHKSHIYISTNNRDPKHPFTHPQSSTSDLRHPMLPFHQNALKNSASTPNLRANSQPRSPALPRWNFKDRLLAAETWCDALLFPRPRLKVKQEGSGTPPYKGSGRIVSPPGSPVFDQPAPGNQLSVTSRVLAHSRSLVDLSTPGAGPSTWRRDEERVAPLPPLKIKEEKRPVQPQPQIASAPSRPPRPKSWALDDSVLPSPVPSLSRVLEEGQILEHQRKKWQTQAINSFQNERARSLSRSRTKSLKAKGSRRPEKNHPNFEFLAARGLLGNQEPISIHVHPPREGLRPRASSQTDGKGPILRWSPTHGHSLSKATTKSSKTHSRNHSRSDSLGKSALKVAKSTAALCVGGIVITPVEENDKEKSSLHLGVYTGNNVMRIPSPERISPFDVRVSPTPSGISDSKVGIAISTTPNTDEAFDRDSIRLPQHPYAQGGLSAYASQIDEEVAEGEPLHAESSRSPVSLQLNAPSTHPYALASGSPSSEDYDSRIVPRARPDSLVPPPEKMWATWGSGTQEVLATELQYSPFITVPGDIDYEKSRMRRSMRNSSPIYDTAGIGEALAWAGRRQSRDSGLGTSEGPESITVSGQGGGSEELSSPVVMAIPSGSNARFSNPRRIPVQYDASRPAHLQHAHKNSLTSTPTPPVQMSSLEEQPEPETSMYERLVVPRNDSNRSSPGQSSSSSSPPVSPPPLGNPDDLENYHDLFYRPRGISIDSGTPPLNPRSPTYQPPNIPWDVRSQGTNNTGLTSIVRQLSEELEETRGARMSRSISFSSRSSLSILRQSTHGRSAIGDSGLRFVFADIPETASVEAVPNVKPVEHDNEDIQDAISAFYPSGQIPEDIETSTRASSPVQSAIEHDELDAYRLGHVESVSTPPAEASDPRLSYVGQMSFAHGAGPTGEEDEDGDVLGTSPMFTRNGTAHNSLQPPSADPTRSSYMTSNSEGSRMSGLSDFPVPPPQQLTPAHMSLLSSYFDETLTPGELAQVQAQGIHHRPGTRSRAGSVTATLATVKNTGQNTPADHQSLYEQPSYFGNTKEIDDLLEHLSPPAGR